MASSASAGSNWLQHLPFMLLGIRAGIKEDSGYSPADLVYGAPLRLPGEFVSLEDSAQAQEPSSAFVSDLRRTIRSFAPMPVEHHAGGAKSSVPKELSSATHVFVRIDAVKKPLVRPYEGPFEVKQSGPKTFILNKHGVDWTVSVDRLKVANLPSVPDLPDISVKPFDQVIGRPDPPVRQLERSQCSECQGREESDPPDVVFTCSGRISRPVVPFSPD